MRWRRSAQVTLFEADAHFGGHSHTVDVRLNGVRHGVDTGFLVFNHRTYPRLVELFDELDVATARVGHVASRCRCRSRASNGAAAT